MGSPPNCLGRNTLTGAPLPAQRGNLMPKHKSPPEVSAAPAEEALSGRVGCPGQAAGPAAQRPASAGEGTRGLGAFEALTPLAMYFTAALTMLHNSTSANSRGIRSVKSCGRCWGTSREGAASDSRCVTKRKGSQKTTEQFSKHE